MKQLWIFMSKSLLGPTVSPSLLGIYLGVRWLGPRVGTLILWSIAKLFSEVVWPFYIPIRYVRELLLLHIITDIWCDQFFESVSLMMPRIFSCVYWPYIYILWWNACSNLLTFPNWVCYNCVFRVLYKLKIHILYKICDLHVFFPCMWLVFHSFQGLWKRSFKYMNVWFFKLWYFSFQNQASHVILNNYLIIYGHKDSSGIFIFLGFIFKLWSFWVNFYIWCDVWIKVHFYCIWIANADHVGVDLLYNLYSISLIICLPWC